MLQNKYRQPKVSFRLPAYIYTCVLCTHVRIQICRDLVHLDHCCRRVSIQTFRELNVEHTILIERPIGPREVLNPTIYFCVRICHMFLVSKNLRRVWSKFIHNFSTCEQNWRMPPRIGKFQKKMRPNTFFNRKSIVRSGNLFARAKVVHRPRSDFHVRFDIRNI